MVFSTSANMSAEGISLATAPAAATSNDATDPLRLRPSRPNPAIVTSNTQLVKSFDNTITSTTTEHKKHAAVPINAVVKTTFTHSTCCGGLCSIKMSDDDILTVQRCLAEQKGSCFVSSSTFRGPLYFDAVRLRLSEGAEKIYSTQNAGGNSEISEAMSFEILRAMFGAKLVKTEMAIQYEWCISKRTDYSCTIFGTRYGVSVTRAMKFKGVFTDADARTLLSKKLFGVNMSSRDVVERDSWKQQILHILATDSYIVDVLAAEYAKMADELKSNTVVIVTVAAGNRWIFYNI